VVDVRKFKPLLQKEDYFWFTEEHTLIILTMITTPERYIPISPQHLAHRLNTCRRMARTSILKKSISQGTLIRTREYLYGKKWLHFNKHLYTWTFPDWVIEHVLYLVEKSWGPELIEYMKNYENEAFNDG